MGGSVAFVTVGSTKFTELINMVLEDSTLGALKVIGITTLKIQTGSGSFTEANFKKLSSANKLFGIDVENYQYKTSILEDILSAKVVIGHAGAGTCLECLKLRKPLIVVVNENLMDNHQMELATALAGNNHLLYCTPQNLVDTIGNDMLFKLIPFDPPNQNTVARFINRRLGID